MKQSAHIGDFPYKLLIFMLYAELDMQYIRRQRNRYLAETRPLCTRFRISLKELHRNFRFLERAGYIYNLSIECGRIRYYANLPKYLTFTHDAENYERHVAETRIPS